VREAGRGVELRPPAGLYGAGGLWRRGVCRALVPGRQSESECRGAGVGAELRSGSFSIAAVLDVAVRRELENLSEAAWQPCLTLEGITTDRENAETVHSMNGAEQAFRLIALRWADPRPLISQGSPP
jgi:hypothetical protein